jgi:hypothetical protein
VTDTVFTWLLEGDPSVVWQTERDLLDADAVTWRRTRQRVAREGWGRRLLDAQDAGGTWADGMYTPKWTSTTYTLLLLRRLGLDHDNEQALAGAVALLDGARQVDGGVAYGRADVAERCINAMVLSVASWFRLDDVRVDDIADLLLRAQMADGGWNCRDERGATHSSFHTTISTLEALTEWQRHRRTLASNDALAAGREFLLAHRLFRSHRTGDVIDERWLSPAFPPRWHYDVLRGLDHLRDVDAPRDTRAAEAIGTVEERRRSDGRWGIGSRYSGEEWFRMESGRSGGRWNTLRTLRVLRWWSGGSEV